MYYFVPKIVFEPLHHNHEIFPVSLRAGISPFYRLSHRGQKNLRTCLRLMLRSPNWSFCALCCSTLFNHCLPTHILVSRTSPLAAQSHALSLFTLVQSSETPADCLFSVVTCAVTLQNCHSVG